MTHHSFTPRSIPCSICSIDNLTGCVPQTQIDGLRMVSEIFRKKEVKHVVVGGLAVGANGYLRNTNNLDFLVDDNAFIYSDRVVYVRNDLPIKYSGTRVNWISMAPSEKPIFGKFLVVPARNQVPIMPIEPLIAMKLIAARHKDKTDIVELIKAGADIDPIIAFVEERFPTKLPLLRQLIGEALDEE